MSKRPPMKLHLKEGGLHQALGVPEGQKIPMAKKEQAARSSNEHVREMGQMAVNMAGWKHKGHHSVPSGPHSDDSRGLTRPHKDSPCRND